MAEKTVTLQPGESQVIAFEAIPSKAKFYQVSVNGLSGSFRAIAPVPDVELIDFSWDAAQPFLTNSVHVASITLYNPTPWDWEYTINVKLLTGIFATTVTAVLLIPAGQTLTKAFSMTMPSYGGDIECRVRIYESRIRIKEFLQTVRVISPVIPPTELAGHILLFWLWYEGIKWKYFDRGAKVEVPLGKEVYVGVPWINDSEVPITGHIDLMAGAGAHTEPLTATIGQDLTCDPGKEAYVQFEPFTLTAPHYVDEVYYIVVAELYGDGQLLDKAGFAIRALRGV